MDGVQSSLSYRCNRAEKLAAAITNESQENQKKVQTEIDSLREVIDRYEETLVNDIKEKEDQQIRELRNFRKQVQGEQQTLIKEIFHYVTVNKDKEPQKMAEAKRRFNAYKETATGKLLQLKVPPRIERHVPNLNQLRTMATDIQNIKLADKPKVQNDALQRKLAAGRNGQILDLQSSDLNDQDMETLADELASNTVCFVVPDCLFLTLSSFSDFDNVELE